MNIEDCFKISAYTSMFHALRSLLFKDGIKERSHLCAIEYAKFNYSKIRGDLNSVDFYRRCRHTALYGLEPSLLEKDAKEAILFAREFLIKIKRIH